MNGGNHDKHKHERGHNKNGKRKTQNHDGGLVSSYRGVSFRERPSSGRPGSPHQYFEHSYDVKFDDGDPDGNGDCSGSSATESAGTPSGWPSPPPMTPLTIIHGPDDGTDAASRSPTSREQAVHCHLNGLCIVTAGTVLENATRRAIRDVSEEGGWNGNHDGNLEISSLEYLVKVRKDSQSARGKLRMKNKRPKRAAGRDGLAGEGGDPGEEHDGIVLPRDPLCRIILSDEDAIILRCCVEGSVIELNPRLPTDSAGTTLGSKREVDGATGSCVGNEEVGQSLLLKDPLLDGYLAVILPSKGTFPSKDPSKN